MNTTDTPVLFALQVGSNTIGKFVSMTAANVAKMELTLEEQDIAVIQPYVGNLEFLLG